MVVWCPLPFCSDSSAVRAHWAAINFRAAKSIPGVSCLTAASALRRQVIKDPSVAMASLVYTAFVVNLPKLNA